MAQKNVFTKLQKELKRNPKKTAILGLGVLVACYFWAPLLAGWFGGGEGKKKSPSPSATTTATAPPVQQVGEGPAEDTLPKLESWDKMLAWIEEDPRMSPGQLPETGRDPFQAVMQQIVADNPLEDSTEEQEAASPRQYIAMTPQEVGLVLTATVLSSDGGWAQINDEEYRLGDTIETVEQRATPGSSTMSQSEDTAFTLEEIHRTHVVLSNRGRRHRLELTQPGLPAGSHFDLAAEESESN